MEIEKEKQEHKDAENKKSPWLPSEETVVVKKKGSLYLMYPDAKVNFSLSVLYLNKYGEKLQD